MNELFKFVAPRVVKFTAGLIVGYVLQNYILPAAQAKTNTDDDGWEIFKFTPSRWET